MQGIKKLEKEVQSVADGPLELFGDRLEKLAGWVENADPDRFKTASRAFESLWTRFRPRLIALVKNELSVFARHHERLKNGSEKDWQAYARMRMRIAFACQYPAGRGIAAALTPEGRRPDRITVDPVVQVLPKGGRVVLSAVVRDRKGNLIEACQFQWSSKNPSVAPVDASGVVYALAAGDTEIQVMDPMTGLSGSARVMVF